MIYDGNSLISHFRAASIDEPFKPYDINSFACKCGCGTNYIDNKFVDFCNYFFKERGFMLTVTSGCRCEKHNKTSFGKELSNHIAQNGVKMSTACDIDYQTLDERNLIIYEAIKFGFKQIICYVGAKTFIHIGSVCNSNFNIFLINKVTVKNKKYEYELI